MCGGAIPGATAGVACGRCAVPAHARRACRPETKAPGHGPGGIRSCRGGTHAGPTACAGEKWGVRRLLPYLPIPTRWHQGALVPISLLAAFGLLLQVRRRLTDRRPCADSCKYRSSRLSALARCLSDCERVEPRGSSEISPPRGRATCPGPGRQSATPVDTPHGLWPAWGKGRAASRRDGLSARAPLRRRGRRRATRVAGSRRAAWPPPRRPRAAGRRRASPRRTPAGLPQRRARPRTRGPSGRGSAPP